VVDGELQDNTIMTGFKHLQIIENLRDFIHPVVREQKLGLVFGDGLIYILYADKAQGIRDTPPRIHTADVTLTVESLFPGLTINIADLFEDEYE